MTVLHNTNILKASHKTQHCMFLSFGPEFKYISDSALPSAIKITKQTC